MNAVIPSSSIPFARCRETLLVRLATLNGHDVRIRRTFFAPTGRIAKATLYRCNGLLI